MWSGIRRRSNHELVHLPDPGHRLEHVAREVRSVSHIELSAEAIANERDFQKVGECMALSVNIELAPGLVAEGRAALRKYLTDPFQLSDPEWQQVRSAIDLLARSTIIFAERRYTFQQFYAFFINGTYARPYLRQLAETDAPERDGPQLQAETARKILAWLRLNGLTPSAFPGAEYLTIYCLYRWASFGRGYLFERIVIQDLRAAGIALAAHAPNAAGSATRPVICPSPASAMVTSRHRSTSWRTLSIHDRISTSRACTMLKVAPSGKWSS